jgi:peptide/nickel transport system ATP-binding protein
MVSALDVSIQAQILNLLNRLKYDLGLTYLFISHDLSVVKYMSNRILVMQNGSAVELGPADSVYNMPQSEYTKRLIDSVPKL